MKVFTVFIILIFVVSCGLSDTPIFTEKDKIEIPEIEGKWLTEHDSIVWELKKYSNKNYKIFKYIENDTVHIFNANFITINNQFFIDLQMMPRHNDDKKMSNIHVIGKITFSSSNLQFYVLDNEYLIKKIKTISHRKEDGTSDYNLGPTYILNEPTKKLQELIMKYSNDPKVFQYFLNFKRFK
jgi:hypothetical protein